MIRSAVSWWWRRECDLNLILCPKDEKEAAWLILKQKPLKGIDKERVEAVDAGLKFLHHLTNGLELDQTLAKKFYGAMSKDIANERKRIGGDWVITQGQTMRSR